MDIISYLEVNNYNLKLVGCNILRVRKKEGKERKRERAEQKENKHDKHLTKEPTKRIREKRKQIVNIKDESKSYEQKMSITQRWLIKPKAII